MLVCGNTASMLADTRYGAAFKVIGSRDVHFGKFGACNQSGDCGTGDACC
jgi:hypothetical protein